MAMSSWEELRKQARHLENEIDQKIVALGKLGTTYGSPYADKHSDNEDSLGASDHMFDTMAVELQQLLHRLSEVNDRLSDFMGPEPKPQMVHLLMRHREILNDYMQEFKRTKANIRQSREKAELLSSVHRNIDSYHNAASRRQDMYLKEHEHINSSSRLTDDAIGIAVNAKEALLAQRQMFHSISARVSSVFSRFPVINNTMKKINIRKRRDAIIIAVVISVCLILMILYSMH